MTISMVRTSVCLDKQAIEDLYEYDQDGHIGVNTSLVGVSIGIINDVDAAACKPQMS